MQSSNFGPWPASLMSCTGLDYLEPRGMAQSVLDENHKKQNLSKCIKGIKLQISSNIQNANAVMLHRFDEVAFMMALSIALASFDCWVAPFPRGASSG